MSIPELVSIILPTYNRAHLLPTAIDSVLAQTYQNWELILWDDGSTDETGKVLKSLSDPRISYYSQENQGKAKVLNHCLELAGGNLIAFLDDDDQWLPEKLEVQVDAMTKWPEIDLVFANFCNINVESNVHADAFEQTSEGLARLMTRNMGDNWWLIRQGFLEGITRENFIAFDSVMIRNTVIEQVGGFNENLKNSEDLEYWWRFGLKGMKAAYTDKIVLNRFKYPGSLSGKSIGSVLGFSETLDACKELAIEQDHIDQVDLLKPLYRNTWHNLILEYGKKKDFANTFSAFRHSLKYGFRPGAFRLLLRALMKKLFG